jgi:hypothetical protein
MCFSLLVYFFVRFAIFLRTTVRSVLALTAGMAGLGLPVGIAGIGAGVVKFGSYFHQFIPICSALSTEHTNKRIRMVSNSTFASETRMSPAMTSPLSRIRSRMSMRFVVPCTVGTLSINVGFQPANADLEAELAYTARLPVLSTGEVGLVNKPTDFSSDFDPT